MDEQVNVFLNVAMVEEGDNCKVEVYWHDPICDDWNYDEELTRKDLSVQEAKDYIEELQQRDLQDIIIQDIRFI